jgi:hypothetical protein
VHFVHGQPSGRARRTRLCANALAFRNVDLSPDDPVSAWPFEAIQTALECGGLSHWRRLTDEIRAYPLGPVACRIEKVLGYSRPYGVAVAMERAIAQARKAAETSEREAAADGDGDIASLVDTWRDWVTEEDSD